MKKLILFIMLCFLVAACAYEKVNDSANKQINVQIQENAFHEEEAKQQLADYLNIQGINRMKVISQEMSSYVIQTEDTTQEQDDMQFIYEHTYTVSNDGTTYEHTIPEKLIGTWSNQDHTTIYTMTDTALSINYEEIVDFYIITGSYITLNQAGLNIYSRDDTAKYYTMIWDTDEYLKRNPSLKHMNPQPFICNYNTLTDTFNVGDQIFTRDDTKKAQNM